MISSPIGNSAAPVIQARPAWIDDNLLQETISVWEPIYGRALTATEAIEILLSVGRLLDAL